MPSSLEQKNAKVSLGLSGQLGSVLLFPVVTNKIVTSTNMKNGTYTIAAQPIAPAVIGVRSTAVGTADTQGTVAIVGTDALDVAQSESVIPAPGTTVYTTKMFKTITSVTGADWAVSADAQNDTIIVGVGASVAPTGFYYSYIQVVAAAVVASQKAQSGFYTPDFTKFTSIPVGIYNTRLTSISLTSGQAICGLAQL